MTSLRGYLRDTSYRFRIVSKIKGMPKFSLCICQILLSTPNIIRRRIGLIDNWLLSMTRRCFRNKTAEVFGLKFILMDEGSLKQAQPNYESWIWKYLKLEKGDVVLDIGANIGRYSSMFSEIVGEFGLVVAIEPVPETFHALKEGVRVNELSNVIALNLACWNEESRVRIFLGPKCGYSSLKEDWGLGYEMVEARTIDSIVEELGLNRVDFVKIDVEGSELEVVEGMAKTLELHKPRIVIEVSDRTRSGIVRAIKKFGYNHVRITDDEGTPVRPDSLYLRPGR